MNAVIISIGNELLNGQVMNTNAAFIAQKLNSAGIGVQQIVTIGDDETQIVSAFDAYLQKHDIAVVTGGLGPTHDDVTRSAVCKFFNTDLILDDAALTNIKAIMQKRNIPLTKTAEDQARVPRGCIVIPNRHGTASGMLFERGNKFFIVMPGVPYEMESMVTDFLLPYFQKKNVGQVIYQRTLKTTGISESSLTTQLGDLNQLLQGASLAFLPAPSGVRLRITVIERETQRAEQKLKEVENRIRTKAEKHIYGIDEEELEDVVGKILTERKLTIAIAESCTGGEIAHRITNVPGSSNYFERGVITYSNRSKTEILGIKEALIQQHGAVSKEVAEAMALGIRQAAKTDIGISTTGVAGPTGGTPEKPIGLVWIGYSDAHETLALKFHFGDERIRFKERTSQAALELVRRKLLKIKD